MTIKQGVYIIAAENGLTKIGCTGNFDQRMKDYRRMPMRITVVKLIETPDYSELEAFLHRAFEAKRSKNEWFKLDQIDLSILRSVEPNLLETLSDDMKETPSLWAYMQPIASTVYSLFADLGALSADYNLPAGWQSAITALEKRFRREFSEALVPFAVSVAKYGEQLRVRPIIANKEERNA